MHPFEKEGIRAARLVLHDANPSIVSNLYSSIDQAINQLESISLLEITNLQEGNEARLEKIQRLARSLKKLEKIAEINLFE